MITFPDFALCAGFRVEVWASENGIFSVRKKEAGDFDRSFYTVLDGSMIVQ